MARHLEKPSLALNKAKQHVSLFISLFQSQQCFIGMVINVYNIDKAYEKTETTTNKITKKRVKIRIQWKLISTLYMI